MGAIEILINGVNKTEAAFSGVSGGLDKLQGSFQKVQAAASGTAHAMGEGIKVGAQISLAGVVALGAGVAALGAVIGTALRVSTEWANQLDSLGDVLGTNAQQSAALAVAIRNVGGNVEAISGQFTFMARGLETMKGELGPTGQALKDLGINVYNSNGSLKDATEIATAAANVFARMPDGIEKSALMTRVFGKSGKELSDVMNEMANGGLARAGDQAREFGLVLSDTEVFMSKQFDRTVTQLGMRFQGFGVAIGTEVLPQIKLLADNLLAFLNTPEVVSGFQRLGEGIAGVVQAFNAFLIDNDIFGKLKQVVRAILDFRRAVDESGIVKTVLGGIGDAFRNLLDGVVRFGSFVVNFLAERWGQIQNGLDVLRAKFNDVTSWIRGMVGSIQGMFESQGWAGIADLVWVWAKAAAGFAADRLNELVRAFTTWANSSETQKGFEDGAKKIGEFIGSGIKYILGLRETSTENLDALEFQFRAVTREPSILDGFAGIGAAIGKGMYDGLYKHLHDVDWGQLFADLAGWLGWGLADMLGKFDELGRKTSLGIVAGINAKGPEIGTAIRNQLNDALTSAMNSLRINSPSLVFAEEIGGPIMEGVAFGITQNAGLVSKALQQGLAWSKDPNSFMAAFGQSPTYALDVMSKFAWARNAAIAADPFYTDPKPAGRDDSAYAGMQRATGKQTGGTYTQVINVYGQYETAVQDFQMLKALAS